MPTKQKILGLFIVEYQKIREKHGDKAKTTKWLLMNGHGSFYDRLK